MTTPPPSPSPARAPAPPAPAARPDRPAGEPDEAVRQSFEQALRAAEPDDEEVDGSSAAAVAGGPADWGLLPPTGGAWRDDLDACGTADTPAPADVSVPGLAPRPDGQGGPAPDAASVASPASGLPAAPTGSDNAFARLALPLAAPADGRRFEVLQGSTVTGIAVETAASGATTLTVTAAGAHAAALERQLPVLQRRLADRAAHVRVASRTPDDGDR